MVVNRIDIAMALILDEVLELRATDAWENTIMI